jgi:CDP-diglyceride synthetase
MSSYLIFGIVIFLGGVFFGFVLGTGFGLRVGLRATPREPSPLTGIFCFIGAAVLLLIAIGTTAYSVHFLNASTQTEGVIVEIRESMDKDGGTVRYPVYRYHDSAGHEYTSTTSMSDGSLYAVGDRIRVRYLSGSPDTSRIDTFAHHWFLTLFAACAAAVVAVVGWVFQWRYRTQVRKGEAIQTLRATAAAPGS